MELLAEGALGEGGDFLVDVDLLVFRALDGELELAAAGEDIVRKDGASRDGKPIGVDLRDESGSGCRLLSTSRDGRTRLRGPVRLASA